jgi:hypothetical protein
MTELEWLADEDNQEVLYKLGWETLLRLAPEQLPYYRGIFPNYVELAQEGQVLVSRRSQPYALAEPMEVVATLVTQVGIEFLSSLIFASGAWFLKEAGERLHHTVKLSRISDPLNGDHLRTAIRELVGEPWIPTNLRGPLEESLLEAIETVFLVSEVSERKDAP